MKELIELLKMRHERAMLTARYYIMIAECEKANSHWTTNWADDIKQALLEAQAIESEIHTLLESKNGRLTK